MPIITPPATVLLAFIRKPVTHKIGLVVYMATIGLSEPLPGIDPTFLSADGLAVYTMVRRSQPLVFYQAGEPVTLVAEIGPGSIVQISFKIAGKALAMDAVSLVSHRVWDPFVAAEYAAWTDPTPADILSLCEARLYAIGQNSWSRPHTALQIAKDICNSRPEVAWQFVMANWSGFDLILHDGYRHLFAKRIMRKWWSAGFMPADAKQFYDGLPALLTVYLGQDASHDVGLSWTTDIDIAKRFARGHRAMFNAGPVALESEVR